MTFWTDGIYLISLCSKKYGYKYGEIWFIKNAVIHICFIMFNKFLMHEQVSDSYSLGTTCALYMSNTYVICWREKLACGS